MNYSSKDELKKMDEYYTGSNLNHVYQRHREKIILLLNTIESVWKAKKLDEQSYKELNEGLENSWLVVFFYIVGKQINLMVGKIDGIEKLLLNGIENPKWQIRFNTVVIMKEFKHKKIRSKVIESALNDKSKRIREMAIDVKNYYVE
jgi:hypothetical protein